MVADPSMGFGQTVRLVNRVVDKEGQKIPQEYLVGGEVVDMLGDEIVSSCGILKNSANPVFDSRRVESKSFALLRHCEGQPDPPRYQAGHLR